MKNVANVQERAESTVHDAVNTDSELYKVGTVVTAAFAGGVGLWAAICLSSAFLSEGGPVGFAKSLFSAISGTM